MAALVGYYHGRPDLVTRLLKMTLKGDILENKVKNRLPFIHSLKDHLISDESSPGAWQVVRESVADQFCLYERNGANLYVVKIAYTSPEERKMYEQGRIKIQKSQRYKVIKLMGKGVMGPRFDDSTNKYGLSVFLTVAEKADQAFRETRNRDPLFHFKPPQTAKHEALYEDAKEWVSEADDLVNQVLIEPKEEAVKKIMKLIWRDEAF